MLDRRTLLAGLAGAASIAVVGGVAVAAPPPGKGPKPKPTPTPSPTPTATATATECVETPATVTRSRCVSSGDGWPDATTTGVPAGTSLTTVGFQELNTPGTILEDKLINGYVDVNAPGCIIRRCKVTNNNESYGIYNYADTGTPLLVEDVEIDMQDHQSTGMGPDNFTARRVHIKGAENAFGGINHDVLIEDCFVETIYEGVDGHADCVQVFAPTDGVVIRHNRLHSIDSDSNGGSSCIALPQQIQGTCQNVTIENNLVAGGSYAIYGYQGGTGTNVVISGNRFSTIFSPNCGDFGPWTDASDETVSDNRWHDGPNAGQLI